MIAFADLVKTTEFPEDRFLNIEGVPVFTAHEGKLSDGRQVQFGPEELAAIAANCNRRIAETGDYAVVTIGHTPRPGEEKPPPEVVGFAGPFRVEPFGGKPAIVADFHIFQEYKDVLRRYPRRSPEFRLVEDLKQVHLDPIALLGAEPPRLDMGLTLLYSELADGKPIERYAFAMPAGSNTFVPSTSTKKETFQMNEEQLQLIIDALEKLDWVQWIKRKMAEEAASQQSKEQLQDQPSDTVDPEKAKKILEEGQAHGKPLTEDQRKMFGAAANRQQDADPIPRERYQLLQQQLESQKNELAAMRKQLDEERAIRVNAERYSQLVQLRQCYAFDLDKEVERCRYSRMTEDQFRDHLEVIRENYQRIPVGERLPPLGSALHWGRESQEQYSEDQRRRARQLVLAAIAEGKELSLEEALEKAKTST